PSRPSSRAIARPMPELAPVTSAARPLSPRSMWSSPIIGQSICEPDTMLKFTVAIVAVGVLITGCVIESAGMDETPSLVRDADTGNPVSGAYVIGVFGYMISALAPDSGRFSCTGVEVVTTDTNGRFAFRRPENPRHLEVYKEGYWEARQGTPSILTVTRKDW